MQQNNSLSICRLYKLRKNMFKTLVLILFPFPSTLTSFLQKVSTFHQELRVSSSWKSMSQHWAPPFQPFMIKRWWQKRNCSLAGSAFQSLQWRWRAFLHRRLQTDWFKINCFWLKRQWSCGILSFLWPQAVSLLPPTGPCKQGPAHDSGHSWDPPLLEDCVR